MKKISLTLLSLVSVALLGGCVSLEEFDRVTRHLETEQQNSVALAAENERMHGELNKARNENATLKAKIDEMRNTKAPEMDTDKLLAEIRKQWGMEKNGDWEWVQSGGAVGVRLDDSGVLFKSGSWELTDGTKATLKKLAASMKSKLDSSGNVVRIDGHTDTDPIKNLAKSGIKDNVHLSIMRAMAVREYLSGKECGLPADRIFVAGFGEFWPVEMGKDPKSKQRNRRVEIYMGTADGLSIGKLPAGTQVSK
ncbi:MAG: OmpA family protein [Planctomycetes bacterium]|jgi:flagellar motor protein MotB|nr:OmpA family protein [Planctomycetota bacterium]MCL4731790.1 OmpA family protein [Planctomycetota bacterium]